MPGPSPHALIWSEARQCYELALHGRPEQAFQQGDESAWQDWLAKHSAFAFVGRAGRLSILKEARSRGSGYWYAYRTRDRQTHKRYLGPTARVTFARLEEAALEIGGTYDGTRERSEGRQAETGAALLSPRFSRPLLASSFVERQRLLGELDSARSHPLMLISASAGSGKTTLLSTWAAHTHTQRGEGRPVVVWLSLEELDNNLIRFWASIIVALQACLPEMGKTALALLHSPESPPISIVLLALLNEIQEVGAEIILILDDYHLIEERVIHESLLFLLEHIPFQLHLVLATRTDPDLPLSRLRARGQLIEIRDQDLRFTQEEAGSFLKQGMALPLTEDDVAVLHQRTEGWIAGLQLAALSLRKQEDLSARVAGFAGSHRFLLDYVQEEILAQLPDTQQQFLLQTSILARMNAALCQAVTALPSPLQSQQMLETLERTNLFIVPLDEQRQWYRFHDLFREALLARLQARQPEMVSRLHARAARFYEAEGRLREAIAHALAAPDYRLAASLMEQAAPEFWLSGEARAIHAWVLSLPDNILSEHIGLALDAALHLLNSITIGPQTVHADMQAQVEQTIARMKEILRILPRSGTEITLRRLSVLRALIEVIAVIKRGDQARLRRLSEEIAALPADEEVQWNLIPLYFAFWRTALLQGEGASLVARLLQAKQQIIAAGDSLLTIRVMSWLAFAYIQAAQLHQAQQECLEALALAERSGARTIMVGYMHHFLFQICYAWNQLEEAADWLDRSLRIAQEWQLTDLLLRGKLLEARLSQARGNMQEGQQTLQQIEALIEQEGLVNHAPAMISLRVQGWLAEANQEEAARWAEQTTLSPEAWNPLRKQEVLTLARVYLAQRQYARASETLELWQQHLDRPGDIDTAIEFLVLYVEALHYGGKGERALRCAARLFALTEPEGYIRVYLDAGLPMKRVLLALLETSEAIPGVYVSRLLAAFEQEEGHRTHLATARTPHKTEQGTPIEPLSPQEQRVLRLLVAGQTYVEMARALIVSPNTIKTQVSSIYRKLGVNRRTEAIRRAQRLRLL